MTIAAISSAVGPARRMIIRVSGPAAAALVGSLTGLDSPAPNSAIRITLHLERFAIPAWLYFFQAPRSYTGDDLAEFHIPGNPLLARKLLEELLRRGARQADPGEFTARAYFNGKMDITAAEGVAAAIAAHGEEELAAARQLLSGELTRRLQQPIDDLTQTLALIETGIDFSDEDVSFLTPEQARQRIGDVRTAIQNLVAGSARFERLSHEVEFVLVGRPNAGKSTLLNVLAGVERAVVSPIPGTTRDALSAEVILPHGLVRLTDVAGLDFAVDPPSVIESQMRDRALLALERADRMLLVLDLSDARPVIALSRRPDLVIATKGDLVGGSGEASFSSTTNRHPERTREASGLGLRGQILREYAQDDTSCSTNFKIISDNLVVSAHTGHGIPELRARLDALAFGQPAGAALALNARHLAALDQAVAALSRALDLTDAQHPETLAFEIRDALDSLGQVAGVVTPDDVLSRVFSTFCIGK